MMKMKECPYSKKCTYKRCPENFQSCFEFLRFRDKERKNFLVDPDKSTADKELKRFWEKQAEKDIKPIEWKITKKKKLE